MRIMKGLTYGLDLLQLGLLLLNGLQAADLLTLVHPGASRLLDHGQDLQGPRERERERHTQRQREKQRQKEREGEEISYMKRKALKGRVKW